MSNTNNVNVPEAKSAMNRFKMECASEVGVQLTDCLLYTSICV